MQDPTTDLHTAVDPEEETEKKLVRYMGLAVVFVVAAGVVALALWPYLKRMGESTGNAATGQSAAA